MDETGTRGISKTHDHRQVFAHLSTGLSFKIGQRSPDVRRKLYIPPEMSDNSDILARSWVDCCQFVTNDVEGARHACRCTSDHGWLCIHRAGCHNRHSHRTVIAACEYHQPGGASDRRVRLRRQYSCEPAIEVIGRESRNLEHVAGEQVQAYEGV